MCIQRWRVLKALTIHYPIPTRIKLPLPQSRTPTRISPSHKIGLFHLIHPLYVALFGPIRDIQFIGGWVLEVEDQAQGWGGRG